jgi:hypothetical protein
VFSICIALDNIVTASLRADLDPARPLPVAWEQYLPWVTAQWGQLLASAPPESKVQTFLEQNPALIPGGLGEVGPGGHHGPHLGGVFRQPELQGLGRRQIPDFMWITRSTSLVTPICIEIERPDRRWFTQAGDPTADLTHARQQINRWRSWFGESANQEIFKSKYLQHQYENRELRPIYLLVYGRSTEFDKATSPHADPDALRKLRDLAAGSDEQFMTFDSLKPKFDYRDFVTLTMAVSGPALHAVPPTFTTGPDTIELATALPDAEEAIRRTPLWSTERKDHVVARWNHWKHAAANVPYVQETGE